MGRCPTQVRSVGVDRGTSLPEGQGALASGGGGLSVEAQARYGFIRRELLRRLPPPARVVEFGAAPGDQIAQLGQAGYDAAALDLGIASDEWSDGRSGRMTEILRAADVELIEWDLENVPYPLPDGGFDAVVMTEVYEHLRDYPIRSLEEAHRVLRPDGLIFFTTPNAAYLLNRLRLLLGRSVSTPLPDWIGGLPHARHAREYTVAEVCELFELTGFRLELVTSRHFHITLGLTGTVARAAKQALNRLAIARPTLGPCTVVIARHM